MNRKKILLILLIFFCFSFFFFLFFLKSSEKKSNFQMQDENEKLEEARQYGDKVIGWLRVEGTNIDLPLIEVTATTDVLNSTYDFAWTNSYPDENSNRPAFISHNIRNVSKNPIVSDPSMRRFEPLMSFIYLDFIQENQYIEYTNQKGITALYRIYAVSLLSDDQSASYSDTYSAQEQEEYIEKVKKESIYDIDIRVDKNDLLLTLFTCTRFYGNTDDYTFRVDARKLRENEMQTLAKVKTNNNYVIIENRMKEGDINAEA